MLRKMLLYILNFMIVFSAFAIPVSADEGNRVISEPAGEISLPDIKASAELSKMVGKSYSVTVSEYDMIKTLQQQSDIQLKIAGYSAREISEIKQPLKVASSYGKVTYTINYTSMYIKKGITYLNTKTTWNWSRRPSFLMRDIIGTTTSEGFVKESGKTTVQYYYFGNKGRKTITESPAVKTKDAGRGIYSEIVMGKNYDREQKDYRNIALSGTMTATWSKSGKKKQTGIASNYGHSIIACTPSVTFTFGSNPSISFTPKKKCKYGDEAYMIAKIK